MNESDFAALNEHLEEVRPILDTFCIRHGFVYVDRRSLGRYPRVRIERSCETKIWFDLWMELDKDGHRIEHFKQDLPYELSAGAYVDVQDGSKFGIRFQKAHRCFGGKPFDLVSTVLQSELEKTLRILESWDTQYLKKIGDKVQLGS